jgi:DNA polymerase-3 subunit delta'
VTTAVTQDVWFGVVGQPDAVTVLQAAAAAADDIVNKRPVQSGNASAMTHAWLFTGPPGSGRSTAARAFAASLECMTGRGCGQCPGCRTVLHGTHADVKFVEPAGQPAAAGR